MDCSLPDSSVLGDSPGKNPGVSCHFLLQGIFPTQGWNLHSPHCRQPLLSEPPGRLRGCGCMGREEDPSVISRRVLTDNTQWSEMFPSEALEETLGHAQGSLEPPMPARGPCLLGGGGRAGQDVPSSGSMVSAPLPPVAAMVQELEKPACLPAAASSRLIWAHVHRHIRVFLKNNISHGPGMPQEDREGRRVQGESGHLVPKGSPRHECGRCQGWPSPPMGRSRLLRGLGIHVSNAPLTPVSQHCRQPPPVIGCLSDSC